MPFDENDVIDQSDDEEMQQVLKMSLESYSAQQKRSSASGSRSRHHAPPVAGPSGSRAAKSSEFQYDGIKEYNERLEAVRAKIRALQLEEQELVKEKTAFLARQQQETRASAWPTRTLPSREGTLVPTEQTTDYFSSFEWSDIMKAKMSKVFGIENFRLCQEGVCNANMAGRDIVCVMPTGGGKSLTYQLPAIMSRGCTLVISPLISLMEDQITHLREYGIAAVMLTGSTTKAESRSIDERLVDMASSPAEQKDDIRLCYVTPEKIAKNDRFRSRMQMLADAGKLARIVIDEAHCISQQGHDFRPDYMKLSSCRTLWPHVPILALSATCPPAVLKDILRILGLKHIVNGQSAPAQGTVYFTSPLYRKNLHYKILYKPSRKQDLIGEIVSYVQKDHPNDSGIIYCSTQNETDATAKAILDESQGRIRTGVYHAGLSIDVRNRLHDKWRRGEVQIVCATNAFGLGIDKGNVRFVIHYSIPKSVDSFYQESGRAGRDGKDADCVLYYRPRDGPDISGLLAGGFNSRGKLNDMLRFAQDRVQCRKVHFAKYFNMSARLDTASWSTAEEDALSPCGHCDNCQRSPVQPGDVTLQAWQILTIAEAVQERQGRVTLAQLATVARGNGKGEFGVVSRGRGKASKSALDTKALVGEPMKLSQDEAEWLCIQLLIDGYLKETWVQTAYSVNTYLEPGEKCSSLTRHSREDIEAGDGVRISCLFPIKSRKSAGKQKAVDFDEERATPPAARRTSLNKRKRKTPPSSADEDSDAEWDFGLRGASSQMKKAPASLPKKKRPVDMDVIELSSD